MIAKIIFVYNADSGRLAAMLDSVKKAAGSAQACSLCTITHGLISKKVEWEDIEDQLGFPTEYFHRDNMPPGVQQHVQQSNESLPLVLFELEDGGYRTGVDAPTLKNCSGDPLCLQATLAAALQTAG